MAEYGKVCPTEAERARRFKYFKDTVGYIEEYQVHRGVELDEFAADSPKEQCGKGQYRECYISLSRLGKVRCLCSLFILLASGSNSSMKYLRLSFELLLLTCVLIKCLFFSFADQHYFG